MGSIRIKHELVTVGENGLNTSSVRRHIQKLANMSIDEKCDKGLNLSAAFFMYTPYVDIINDRKYCHSQVYIASFRNSLIQIALASLPF